MKMFKGKMGLLLAFLVITLSACGGGGGGGSGGGGNQTSSSGSGNTVKEGDFSITVDKSAISVDLPFKSGPTQPVIIKVTYKGDGLIAGFPPGEELNTHLGVGLVGTSSTTADLSISVNFAFTEAKTYTQRVRLVTGKQDGSKYISKDIVVTIKQLDGFSVSEAGAISGLWGDTPGEAKFQIETYAKKWTVSSPFAGITLATVKGTGSQLVSVSYDYLKTPVTTKSVDIVFTADTGETITKQLGFSLYAPDFSSPNQDLTIPNQQLGQSTAPIEIDLSTGAIPLNWTATLPAWLSAKSLTGVTGKDKLQIYVDSSNFPNQDGLLTDSIHLKADVLGGKVERDIKISFPYQQTRIQPSQAAFAFSDYATNQAHSGEFWINTPTDSNTQVVSNSSWLEIDSVTDSKVKFHLDAAALPNGFQTAEIAVSQSNNTAMVPTKVYVGYYKSSTPISYGAAATWSFNAYAVQDKLGPWLYVGKSNQDDALTLIKYNFVTRSVEKSLKVTGVRGVNSMTVSDDGQYLFGLGYDDVNYYARIIIIDLKTFSSYTTVRADTANGDEAMQFVNLDGKNMVSAGSLFDAFTGEMVSYSGYNGYAFPSPSGEYSIAGSNDSIGYLHYDYDYLTGELSRTDYVGQADIVGYKIMSQSNNGKYVGVLNRHWSVTGSRVLSVYKVDKGVLNKPSFTLQHTGKMLDEAYESAPPSVVLGDDGRFALYSYSFGGANLLEIYRADQSLVASYPQSEASSVQKGSTWFYTSDNKALVYFKGPFAADQTLYIYPTE